MDINYYYIWYVYTHTYIYTFTNVYVEAKLFDSVAIYLVISILRKSNIIDWSGNLILVRQMCLVGQGAQWLATMLKMTNF